MTYKETSFNKEAHAISEALGNKSIILNEECDNCNEFFDKNIERDFLLIMTLQDPIME
ncbi:HNH endonuclease [Providencia hangzhouensis]|uniref:HNH endonuclease n=1 Tax=Providencia hangzhouensis TaxID=3031799 RepID=UPI0034DD61A5